MNALAQLIQDDAVKPFNFEGNDWWQLTEEEAAIFKIDGARFPLMVSAFGAFEAFVGRVQGSDWDMKHEAEIALARLNCQ
ncbi:hypothetical protein, partial [Methylobacterium sp. GC_Met_2]|uniref:hypothetical protein n=1 Tax=Methylobacterium sp. GC_Met_2 TaxID=2937376 RepID=UPI00226B53C5